MKQGIKKAQGSIWKNRINRPKPEKVINLMKESQDTKEIIQKIKFEFVKPSSNTYKAYSRKIMNSSDVWNTFSENREISTLQIDRAKDDVIQVIRDYCSKPVQKSDPLVKNLLKNQNIFKAFITEKLLLKKQLKAREDGNILKNQYIDELLEVLNDEEFYYSVVEAALESCPKKKTRRKKTDTKLFESMRISPEGKTSTGTNSIVLNLQNTHQKTVESTIGSADEASNTKIIKPIQRIDTIIDLSKKIPVRKDTHMKISSYMRKQINFKGHRQSDMRQPSKFQQSEEEEKHRKRREIQRSCFSSANITRDLLPEVNDNDGKKELNNTFKNPRNKKAKYFKARNIANNTTLYGTLHKLNILKSTLPTSKPPKSPFLTQNSPLEPQNSPPFTNPKMLKPPKILSISPTPTTQPLKASSGIQCICAGMQENSECVNMNSKVANLLANSHKRKCPFRILKKESLQSKPKLRKKIFSSRRHKNTMRNFSMKI
ncbi:unnamed protein product [Moneuplotes crassus]|uniref:Uncharacterized protein n=1 Tax=Euplotes crassus TaxID=5936 RepID=A0AAD1YBI6_EUPCR|nr:unnamed protein product [Moneuplotes crassus]